MATLVNRAKMSTATTGTGTITLGSAVVGYQSFAAAGVVDGDSVRYVIEDGANWEIGEGTYSSSGTTLARNVSESSNAGSPINLSGSAVVFVGATAQDFFGANPVPWVRNPSWPACEANAGDNKVVGLYAVFPGDGTGTGGNFFAMTNTQAYTINFGDGTVTNFASGATANYIYDYNDPQLANTNAPVTLTASTNTVSRTAHGYSNGMQVRLYDIATTTGINQGQEYYVANATANTFQLSRKSYNTIRIANRETDPSGIFFKPDGLKMYIVGHTGDEIDEFNLIDAWDVSTASYLQSFSVAAQENIPQSVFFKPDGLKMYVMGITNDNINEYNLGTAWNISTASFLQSFSVSAEELNPRGLYIRDDGLKMYVVGSTGDDVNEYNIGTAWDISTSSFVQTFSVSAQETDPSGIFFKPDGTKMYIIGATGDDINEYDLSTAWNVSTASFVKAVAPFGIDINPLDLFFTSDGTKLFIVGQTSDTVMGYDLSTAWDVGTATLNLRNSIVDFSNDGTAALLPYKIATVTITPQGGFSLTSLNFFVKHSQAGLVNNYTTGWLDIAIAAPSCTSLAIGSGGVTLRHGLLERVRINQLGSITSFSSLFNQCRNLRNVIIASTITTVTTCDSMFSSCNALTIAPMFNTANVTTMSNMFSSCNALTSVPLYNTSSVTFMTSMFTSCDSLMSVPLFNTQNVTTMASMFSSCSALVSVPLFNTGRVTNMSNMFSGCSSLQSVPLFNTISVTNMSSMFSLCLSLTSVPLFNTVNVTLMTSMFNTCNSLEYVPSFSTNAATNTSSMFSNSGLREAPVMDLSNVSNTSSMFSACLYLTTVPLYNLSSATNIGSMFSGCSVLDVIPALNVTPASSSTNLASIFANCQSLARIQAKDFRFTFSVASCKLSATALNEIYTNLPTVTGQTITVSGNYGTAGDNPAIATAKGWTVTGS